MARYSRYGAIDSPIATDGDTAFLKMNNRLRPDQLQAAEIAYSSNGRMDVDGAWQTRKGIDSFGPTLTANTESIRLLATPTWKLYSGAVSISSATRSTTTVTVDTSTSHGYSNNTLVYIAGLTGTVNPNGNRLITVGSNPTQFTFTITGATGSETYGGTGTSNPAQLSATAVTGVFGSCLFSNPNTANDNYIILATNLNVQAIKLSDGAATTIAYPTGVTIASTVELLHAFDKVFIFRNGQQPLEWNGSFSGTPAFTVVAGGSYSNPVYLDSSNNTTVLDGVATVSETAHGLSVGDRVYVVSQGSGHLNLDGDGYVIATVPDANTFTFFTQTQDDATHKAVFAKRQSQGLGLMHMPAPAWAVQHQRRLWVPYAYEPAGTSGSPTYTWRNVLDEIVASDILDSDTFDKIQSQYRISAGTADSLVGVEPFAEDNLLVFMRHSIHLIKGISGSLLDTSVNLITKEVGCVARKSIVQIGNQVLFLSDNGVYAAAFGDLYNLRGAGVPLSEPINPLIGRINRNYAQNAVAAYYNNRYYLAVPLDNSTVNNALLVYNFLNQGWESIDTTGQAAWEISQLIVGDTGGLSKLYVVGSLGAIHIIDGREDNKDNLTLYAGVPAQAYPISSYATTRQFTMGTLDRKKFSSYELHVESSASQASNASIAVETENLDSTEALTTIYDLLGNANLEVSEDASLRGRIGNKRGYGAQLTFTPTSGRPKLRAVTLNAAITNLGITQAT
jgi:hypothetical protein